MRESVFWLRMQTHNTFVLGSLSQKSLSEYIVAWFAQMLLSASFFVQFHVVAVVAVLEFMKSCAAKI